MLIVDDELDILKSLKMLFRRDFNVTLASSGEEALCCIKENGSKCYDIILTDQRMKGIQGSDLLKEVYGLCGETASILVTGYVDMPSLIKAINEGRVYGYMGKPWEPDELKKMVYDSIKRLKTIKSNSKDENNLGYDFRGAASHLIQPHHQLLSIIRAFECNNPLDTEQLKSLWLIARNCWLMGISLSNLSLLFEIRDKSREIRFDTINLSMHIKRICADISMFTDQKDIKSLIEIEDNCIVQVDLEIINQVLLALLSNALKYTKPSGSITVRIINQEKQVRVEIQDTGIGIEQDLQKKLLNHIKPDIMKGTENETGSGQGLIIAHEFLKMHHTYLEVKSKKDSGSLFSFNIPKKMENL